MLPLLEQVQVPKSRDDEQSQENERLYQQKNVLVRHGLSRSWSGKDVSLLKRKIKMELDKNNEISYTI